MTLTGKMEEGLGRVGENAKTQAEGVVDQVAGTAQNLYGLPRNGRAGSALEPARPRQARARRNPEARWRLATAGQRSAGSARHLRNLGRAIPAPDAGGPGATDQPTGAVSTRQRSRTDHHAAAVRDMARADEAGADQRRRHTDPAGRELGASFESRPALPRGGRAGNPGRPGPAGTAHGRGVVASRQAARGAAPHPPRSIRDSGEPSLVRSTPAPDAGRRPSADADAAWSPQQTHRGERDHDASPVRRGAGATHDDFSGVPPRGSSARSNS